MLDKETRDSLLKLKGIRLVTQKKLKKSNYKRKIVRHSKQMKDVLKNRYKIEHSNCLIRRSFKYLDNIYERKKDTLVGFIELAFFITTLMKSN